MKKYISKVIVSFSGGKDSLATLILADKKYGRGGVIAVFCDTGWEHEMTYKHIAEVCQELGVELVTIKSKKYLNFIDLAVKKKRFPSTKARFCTEELKTKPMIDFVLDQCSGYCTIIQGIRKDESESRSLMQEHCTYFKYYFQPFKITGRFDKVLKAIEEKNIPAKIKTLIEKLLNIKLPLYSSKSLVKWDDARKKIVELNLLPKNRVKHFHTYRKDEIINWRTENVDNVWRPIFNWTAQETIDFIIQNGMKPNPLYYKGMSRVGCFPCVMCKQFEMKQIIDTFQEYLDRLATASKKVGRSFFPPNYIPERFQTGLDKKSGLKFPTLEDVVKYLNRKDAQIDMFKQDNEDHSCMSFYGICE